MTTCPTCSWPVRIISDKDGTNHYEPAEDHVIHFLSEDLRLKSSLVDWWQDMVNEIGVILNCRTGETVLEAATRWREMVEWYGDIDNYPCNIGDCNVWTPIGEDCGQRARELLGEVKE